MLDRSPCIGQVLGRFALHVCGEGPSPLDVPVMRIVCFTMLSLLKSPFARQD
jgi:hypothetical protein